MFEDLARNLEVPHALGMTTVLVVPEGARVVLREEWELAGRDAPHVDHVTDDLAGFLRGIAAKSGHAGNPLDCRSLTSREPAPDKPAQQGTFHVSRAAGTSPPQT